MLELDGRLNGKHVPWVATGVCTECKSKTCKEKNCSIFCNTEFLSLFQLSKHRPYEDSKTIVDAKLLKDPSAVAKSVEEVSDQSIDKNTYNNLLHSTLTPPPDTPKHQCTPHDYEDAIPAFARYFPEKLKTFAFYLKDILRGLYSRTGVPTGEALKNFDMAKLHVEPRASLLRLPYGYFVPGGRFRECYYWDTYWTVQGLLACGMVETAVGAVRNLLYFVKAHGFVPNGNRTYYLGRSQPPMLVEMVYILYRYINENQCEEINISGKEWLAECLEHLETEYSWWMKTRSVEVFHEGEHLGFLNIYTGGEKNEPRPESYREDKCESGSEEALGHILAACESGWDFSSRWYPEDGTDHPTCETAKEGRFCTRDIAPVCLNSMMLRMETLLCRFCKILGKDHIKEYCHAAQARRKAMMTVMWDDKVKCWRDYNWKKQQCTEILSAAGWFPLWAELYGYGEDSWTAQQAKECVDSLMKHSGLLCVGGVATTTKRDGLDQQWDWPNGWPPVQDYLINGLRRVERKFGKSSGAGEAAKAITQRFVGTLFRCWRRENVMHEKYDVTEVDGKRGAGGEYKPQIGFGWTNGIVLRLMQLYQREIEENDTWLNPQCQ